MTEKDDKPPIISLAAERKKLERDFFRRTQSPNQGIA